ncbi:AAA family ATPase [Hymenobacter metallicola]|uniref:DUF2813 domain-containing protein n=1 Tax=Hymenobacter metallicola TaxID=2563114 RepID=A0A4Z0PT33_9BACT|nr:AAA family ATPase [Hymenobacter metallicola]TGE20890.1 DUF2813 domain-containing protein [Hymenobacter metallicola]
MQRITLDNFRVFGKPAAFDLAPVTVLTGKNNSGKSSLIKAFLVLADYLEQDDQTVLRLDGPRASRHRINNWKNLVNWESDSSSFHISYSDDEITYTYEFDSHPDGATGYLRRFHMDVPDIDQLELISVDGGDTYALEVSQKFLEYVAGGIFTRIRMRRAVNYPARIDEIHKQLDAITAKLENSGANRHEFASLLQERQVLTSTLENLKGVVAKGQQSAGIFFQTDISRSEVEERPTLAAIIEAAIDKYVLKNIPIDESYTLEEIAAEYGVSQDENGVYDEEEMAQAVSTRSAIISQEQHHRELDLKAEEYRIARQFRRELENSRPAIEHLGANRTHQSRLYLTGGGHASEINVVADKFQRLGNYQNGAARTFLRRWLQRFELGDQVKVTPIDNVAIRIEVVRGKQRVNLADLGFGAGQMLTMLLHIATLLQQQEATNRAKAQRIIVLIEEPEANLHPHFQSVLAELFAELARMNTRMQFILETHSEYLIRNIQVLVKNAGENNNLLQKTFLLGTKDEQINMFKVYYLDKPNQANNWQPGHEMRLRKDGIFIEDFGTGFLDESAKLAFEVL